jgi:hypothetical protein
MGGSVAATAGAAALGMVIGSEQAGHFTRFPASDSLAANRFPHRQATEIGIQIHFHATEFVELRHGAAH